jgi:hypothetical protein
MLRAIALLSIGIAGASAVSTAEAADNGFYLGAGITQSKIDVDLGNVSSVANIDDDDNKFKIIAGVRPLDWFAVEVNYVDFGSIDGSIGPIRGEYRLKGFDAFALGLLEVGLVDFYGKAGIVRWDSEARITSLPSAEDDGFDPAYGAGIQAHFGSISARLEYEMFDIDDADVSLITLGLTWTFL